MKKQYQRKINMKEYCNKFNGNIFDRNAIEMSEEVAVEIDEQRKSDWCDTVEDLDFGRDTRKTQLREE